MRQWACMPTGKDRPASRQARSCTFFVLPHQTPHPSHSVNSSGPSYQCFLYCDVYHPTLHQTFPPSDELIVDHPPAPAVAPTEHFQRLVNTAFCFSHTCYSLSRTLMPAPARPAGPISPGDLLWRHELREQNAMLLRRMDALETKSEDQQRRVQKAEEAAATCTDLAEEFDIVKHGVDQLETKQQEFMSAVHKRLVDMNKDMGEFRKTQERVQKLMASHQKLDDSFGDLSSLGTRVEDNAKEIQGLKNSVNLRHVHEMENLDARLEALELQRSREDASLRTMQDEFKKTWNGELQALRTEVMKLKETRRATPVQQPYMQVPRSPEIRPSAATGAVSHLPERRSAPNQAPGRPRKAIQVPHKDAGTQDTTQASTQAEEIEDLDLNTNAVLNLVPHNREAPKTGTSPRKKPKLSHPNPLPEPRQQQQQRPAQKPAQKPQQQPKTTSLPAMSRVAPRAGPSKVVRLPINLNTKKRPGSPITAPKPTNPRSAVATSRQQPSKRPAAPLSLQEQKSLPSQPTRRSRRRSAQATFYELGWDCTQQPQKTAGPVYDNAGKPLKTKPRRLPPVPDE
ncbi:hypothetical protein BU23DRAFT_566780 [Bimuria novae-zelandiae CBS 107.79]|uniref:Uncharacterized protein n=1 Tax=Bimuria novae-zelandiae CBS 107.79 TaxID=1447943 RepID=A0A6A5VJM3_9PLEO|nr:hypothetical protein BU23DRAFT_566780 [Bimuria novae-zelandiae CBS 107.79]